MPTPRAHPSSYPSEYLALFRKARNETVTLPLQSPAAAHSLRGRLYAFRQSLLLFPDFAPDIALTSPLVRTSITNSTLTLYTPELRLEEDDHDASIDASISGENRLDDDRSAKRVRAKILQ